MSGVAAPWTGRDHGGKIAGPTVLARKDPGEVTSLLEGHGYEVVWVEGMDLPWMHERFADALAYCYDRIKKIQNDARSGEWDGERPTWPMIVLRTQCCNGKFLTSSCRDKNRP